MQGKVKNLKRMKARLAGEADASVEVPFELKCDCGESIRGIRRTRGIQKQCDQCGETLFVLPMNVYPATKSVRSEIIGGGFTDRLKVIVSELLPVKKKTQPEKGTAVKSETAVDSAAGPSANAEPAVAPKPRLRLPRLPRIDVRKVLRRTFTPFRLIIFSILCVIGFTGYWLTQQKAEEAARQVWLRSAEQVQALLEDGKMVELETLLSKTIAAGRVLSKSDEEWRLNLNLYQEAKAVNSLAGKDLLTAFHNAYDENGILRNSAVQNITDASQSGTFVFESFLRPNGQTEGLFFMEFPAAPGNQFVSGAIALPQLEKFLDAAPDGRALFAATVESIVAPNDDEQLIWQVELDPTSFVLLTSPDVCNELGLSVEFDPELESILARQKEFVGQTTAWEHRADDVLPKQIESSGQAMERL